MRFSQRDIDGLLLCGEHYGAPYDLLGVALRVAPERVPGVVARWRRAGYAASGRLGPGPTWCWLTREGMGAVGLGFPATRPALGRLAHIRAVLAVRLWLACGQAWQEGQAWWRSERRLRAGQGGVGAGQGVVGAGRRAVGAGQVAVGAGRAGFGGGRPMFGAGHVPDAEIHWPSLPDSPYAGQVWAVEVELTPKTVERTERIMTGMLRPRRYPLVVYLAAPAALSVVRRAAAGLPADEQARLTIRELPGYAFTPEPPR
jgi:hypothetical protein